MADLSISSYSSQEIRDYVKKFDKNGDDKINEGAELNALLSGNLNELSTTDSVKFDGRKKMLINNQMEVEEAIKNFNVKSPDKRQVSVDKTKYRVEARLETLEMTLKSNYYDVRTALENTAVLGLMRTMGGAPKSNAQLWEESLSEYINKIDDIFNKALTDNSLAFCKYIPGNDVYDINYPDIKENPLQTTLNQMGFNSLKDFAEEVAKYEISLNYDGSNYEEYMKNHEMQSNLLQEFYENFDKSYSYVIRECENQEFDKAKALRKSYNNALPALEARVQDGITTENSIKDYTTSRTFEDVIIEEYKTESVTDVEAAQAEAGSKAKTEKMICKYNGKTTVLIVAKENGVIKSAKTLDGVAIDPKNIR